MPDPDDKVVHLHCRWRQSDKDKLAAIREFVGAETEVATIRHMMAPYLRQIELHELAKQDAVAKPKRKAKPKETPGNPE